MPRPETAKDVVELVRQSRLVGEVDLARFSGELSSDESRDGVLGRLVAGGLLTRYQAGELALGQWRSLWLGGYRVLDRLGKGGMSQVYLAEHAVIGKRVAVKVLSANLRADKVARRRFVREARAAAAIDHPNIVQVFDVDMDHDRPYLVMEFVDGISLQAAVAGYGTLTGGETAAVGVEVARGLTAAARAGLVHRDIKPANLLLDRRGNVKILDLGIVRLMDDDTQPPGSEAEEILGTLDYLAPEQAENSSKVDTRADLYALGATLYFLLAGHPPFPSTNLRHKLASKLHSDPPPAHCLRPDVEPGLSMIIQNLLTRDRSRRVQTAVEAGAALEPFATVGGDFPMRFFRPLQASTLTECSGVAGENSTTPVTLLIRKTSNRPSGVGSVDQAIRMEKGDSQGPTTAKLAKAMTDMVLEAIPPELYEAPAQRAKVEDKPASVQTSSWSSDLEARWPFVALLLVLVLGAVLALIFVR